MHVHPASEDLSALVALSPQKFCVSECHEDDDVVLPRLVGARGFVRSIDGGPRRRSVLTSCYHAWLGGVTVLGGGETTARAGASRPQDTAWVEKAGSCTADDEIVHPDAW